MWQEAEGQELITKLFETTRRCQWYQMEPATRVKLLKKNGKTLEDVEQDRAQLRMSVRNTLGNRRDEFQKRMRQWGKEVRKQDEEEFERAVLSTTTASSEHDQQNQNQQRRPKTERGTRATREKGGRVGGGGGGGEMGDGENGSSNVNGSGNGNDAGANGTNGNIHSSSPSRKSPGGSSVARAVAAEHRRIEHAKKFRKHLLQGSISVKEEREKLYCWDYREVLREEKAKMLQSQRDNFAEAFELSGLPSSRARGPGSGFDSPPSRRFFSIIEKSSDPEVSVAIKPGMTRKEYVSERMSKKGTFFVPKWSVVAAAHHNVGLPMHAPGGGGGGSNSLISPSGGIITPSAAGEKGAGKRGMSSMALAANAKSASVMNLLNFIQTSSSSSGSNFDSSSGGGGGVNVPTPSAAAAAKKMWGGGDVNNQSSLDISTTTTKVVVNPSVNPQGGISRPHPPFIGTSPSVLNLLGGGGGGGAEAMNSPVPVFKKTASMMNILQMIQQENDAKMASMGGEGNNLPGGMMRRPQTTPGGALRGGGNGTSGDFSELSLAEAIISPMLYPSPWNAPNSSSGGGGGGNGGGTLKHHPHPPPPGAKNRGPIVGFGVGGAARRPTTTAGGQRVKKPALRGIEEEAEEQGSDSFADSPSDNRRRAQSARLNGNKYV